MEAKKKTSKFVKTQIISALTWVAVILASSFVLQGTSHVAPILNILLAGATTHFLLLSSMAAKALVDGEQEEVV